MLYTFFKEQAIKIGLSRFCSIRPPHVCLSRSTPIESCLCLQHENFRLKMDALYRHDSIRFCQMSGSFRRQCVCDDTRPQCWLQKCSICEKSQLMIQLWNLDDNDLAASDHLHFWTWLRRNGRMEKIKKEATLGAILRSIIDDIPQFLIHCFINKRQTSAFANARAEAQMDGSRTAILQIDFAENFTCVPQDEVQSAYYNRAQVTLFTSYLWFRNESRGFVVASDTRSHTKKSQLFCFFYFGKLSARRLQMFISGRMALLRNSGTVSL